MGVAKAALESTSRYLARDLGKQNIRCNLVAAGPAQVHGRQVDPGLRGARGRLEPPGPARLGPGRPGAGRRGVVALLSDFFPRTTGEIVHVDGGVHMMGA